MVKNPAFDAFFCGVILLNVVVMALELQYSGLQMGYEMGFPGLDSPVLQLWPGADNAWEALEYLFGGIFTLEIIIKVIGQKEQFPHFVWNWIDSFIVGIWIVDRTFQNLTLPIPASVVRLVRMARLLRLLRIVRTIQAFDALYIMTTAIKGSSKILTWTFVLLLLVQTTLAFFLNQLLESYMTDESLDIDSRHLLWKYFGTTTRALFTMFEMALGGWAGIGRMLSEHANEFFIVFAVAFKMVIGFAVVGVVNGIFFQETFNVASNDDRIMLQRSIRDMERNTAKMRTFFKAADSSGDGVLDLEEWLGIMDNDQITAWLWAQGLKVDDAATIFALIDDGDGGLSADEVVAGVANLKGAARSMDLIMFMRQTQKFQELVCKKLGLDGGQLRRASALKASDD